MKLKPQQIFLIDGLGALLSAFLLGVIWVRFENYIGITSSTLYFLAGWPVIFAGFDFYCFFKNKATPLQLKTIAILNFFYCTLSIGSAFYHIKTITILGWLYLMLEIIIVLILAMVEFRMAIQLKNNK